MSLENPSKTHSPRLQLYDTMLRELRTLTPADGVTFRFYCCGPTVYGPAHIGNFRSFVMQDIFRRTLEALDTSTLHVRNITDVDDKTIRQSQAENTSLSAFCQKWTEQFHTDCDALHILPPHVEPSAVAHIAEQIALIETLIAKGNAYRASDGSVYFSIKSFPAYGALSRLSERTISTPSLTPNSSSNTAWNDEYERDSAADFALWKARRPEDGPNFWESPWGEGRPGWHIECSAMSMKYLGASFDLHGGGVDLIFPHHENEIAQSEAATGQRFSAHWFHVAHLLVEGKKMSKSLGNLYTLDDVRERGFTPEELRYVLISGSYRQPLNFTWESLSAAHKALSRLRDLQERLGSSTREPESAKDFGVFYPVIEALSQDINTPEALGQLFVIVKKLQQALDAGTVEDGLRAEWALGLQAVLRVLGFQLPAAEKKTIPEEILALAEQRWQAKLAKDWGVADVLRKDLTAKGWLIKDGATSYEVYPAEG